MPPFVPILLFAVAAIMLLAQTATLWRTFGKNTPVLNYMEGEPQVNQTSNFESAQNWHFEADRHAEDFTLSPGKCEAAFPKLWYEIDRAVAFWEVESNRRITYDDTSLEPLDEGVFRALIHDNQLRILETKGIFSREDSQLAERAVAVWQQIHRALLGASVAGEILPSIEFSVSLHDIPGLSRAAPKSILPLWTFAREYNSQAHEGMFLIPDFNYWSWRGIAGPFNKLRAYSKDIDRPLLDKIPKLVWRGAVWTNPEVRESLVAAASTKPWGDVLDFDWASRANYIPIEDFCHYSFLAHTEGRSWSGRLKYLLNCKSVTLIHERDWTAHYYHLLQHQGPDQNFVSVRRNFSDLEEKIQYLFADREAAQRIADNAVAMFRDRYLTLAAEACYWRKLIRSWSKVAFDPLIYEHVEMNLSGLTRTKSKVRGVAFEELILYRGSAEWPL